MQSKFPSGDARATRSAARAPRIPVRLKPTAATRLRGLLATSITLLAAASLALPAAAYDEEEPPPTRYQSATSRLSLATDSEFGKSVHAIAIQRGKTTVVETAFRVSRVAVGDPKTADFVAISDREISILAREPGDTNMLVWGGGRLQAVIDIHVEGVQPHIVRELTRILDNDSIKVDVAGGSVILRGHVPSLSAFESAGRIAEAFLSRGVKSIGGEQDVATSPEVINLLEVGGGHQVMIEVVIAELRRNISRALGVNIAGKATGSGGSGGTFAQTLSGLTSHPDLGGGGASTVTEAVTLAGSYFSPGTLDLRLFLEAVEASQLGTILAEPNLVARSGEEANFLVGGEVPIPIANASVGGVTNFTIEFKTFGVNVEFLPTVLSKDRIHMRVTPEVSEPDFTLGLTVLGTSVPAFQTRRVNTSIEVGDGESFALAGLIREDIIAQLDEVPFMASVPILGQLFKSRAFQKKQTELVLFVTPHLVQPLEPGTELALPTDAYIEPTLAEFYWDGRIEGRSPLDDDDEEEEDDDSTSASGEEEDAWSINEGPPPGLELGAARDLINVAHGAQPAAYRPTTSTGGFLGPFGHRLRVPKPVGVEEH